MNNAALTTAAQSLTAVHRAAYEAAAATAAEQAVMVNRLALAEMLLEADLPRTAIVQMVDWVDEPNADGSYDVDLGEAYEVDDEDDSYGDLGGTGAIAAGHHDGDGNALGTDWDMFLADTPVEPGEYPMLSVAKVYDWLAAQTV